MATTPTTENGPNTPTPNAPTPTPQTQDPMFSAFQRRAQQSDPANKPGVWSPNPDDPVSHIQTSDGQQYHIHDDDLEKMKQRDPGLKVIGQVQDDPMLAAFKARKSGDQKPPAPTLTPEQARGRTLMNMSRALSGQPMDDPQDQAEAERGRKAGTIAGGIQLATGAAGGLFAPGVQVAQETSSILGPEGQPIVKEVLKKTPSVAAKTASTVVDTAQTIAKWTKENPIKAVAVEALAREIGVDPFQLLGKVIKYGKNLFQ